MLRAGVIGCAGIAVVAYGGIVIGHTITAVTGIVRAGIIVITVPIGSTG